MGSPALQVAGVTSVAPVVERLLADRLAGFLVQLGQQAIGIGAGFLFGFTDDDMDAIAEFDGAALGGGARVGRRVLVGAGAGLLLAILGGGFFLWRRSRKKRGSARVEGDKQLSSPAADAEKEIEARGGVGH